MNVPTVLPCQKRSIFGVLVDSVNMQTAVARILDAAVQKRPMAVSALAVHGLMLGAYDSEHRHRLNHFDLLVPDGQPVRWALNLLHGTKLSQRVYGPDLTLNVCHEAASRGVPIFLYGSNEDVLKKMTSALRSRFPSLVIAGTMPSQFGKTTADQRDSIVACIRASGAQIVFGGLGCPRQEIWAYEMRDRLGVPVLAVGAAFPFIAGVLRQAPAWMQRAGLEWLFRLAVEPGRLWRRYLQYNSAFIVCLMLQYFGLRRFEVSGTPPTREELYA
jgi:N-acetylglucosaminyldiphosphoundecaprenol N-acetyl-beta-D-mannosaminyltransferase